MASRLLAGVLGGIAGIFPLAANAAVDYAATQGLLDERTAHLAVSPVFSGPPALLTGVALGAVVAGWPAGRRGGAPAAGVAGGIAAGLYAVVVIGLVVGGARLELVPSVAGVHPLRTSAAVIFLASVLLGVAWLLGALVGRSAEADATPTRGASVSGSPGARERGPRKDDRWRTSRSGFADRNGYNADDGATEREGRAAYDPYGRQAHGGYGPGGGYDRDGGARGRGRSGPPDRGGPRDATGYDAPRAPAGTREGRPGGQPSRPNRW
jgi:hypothetical protein